MAASWRPVGYRECQSWPEVSDYPLGVYVDESKCEIDGPGRSLHFRCREVRDRRAYVRFWDRLNIIEIGGAGIR